jgi:hypothetical protein
MLIEVNVEDCYGLAQQSADASNLPESAASGEISAETWENWFSVWLENQEAYVPVAPGYEVSLRLTADPDARPQPPVPPARSTDGCPSFRSFRGRLSSARRNAVVSALILG